MGLWASRKKRQRVGQRKMGISIDLQSVIDIRDIRLARRRLKYAMEQGLLATDECLKALELLEELEELVIYGPHALCHKSPAVTDE